MSTCPHRPKFTGKDYDPTAAAREEKERRERRHKTAMENKQAKELAECTFKPAVSRKSVELLQETGKERPSLHTPNKSPSRMKTAYKGTELQVLCLRLIQQRLIQHCEPYVESTQLGASRFTDGQSCPRMSFSSHASERPILS